MFFSIQTYVFEGTIHILKSKLQDPMPRYRSFIGQGRERMRQRERGREEEEDPKYL